MVRKSGSAVGPGCSTGRVQGRCGCPGTCVLRTLRTNPVPDVMDSHGRFAATGSAHRTPGPPHPGCGSPEKGGYCRSGRVEHPDRPPPHTLTARRAVEVRCRRQPTRCARARQRSDRGAQRAEADITLFVSGWLDLCGGAGVGSFLRSGSCGRPHHQSCAAGPAASERAQQEGFPARPATPGENVTRSNR